MVGLFDWQALLYDNQVEGHQFFGGSLLVNADNLLREESSRFYPEKLKC